MVWVKFHDKLCEGAKRGLPRAVRFVFMELCLKTRPGRGVMDLPLGMSDLDALHDTLGGNRKEIADAIAKLTAVPKPTEGDPKPRAMVELTGEDGARRLTIPAWEAWNTGQETPGSSTARSRKHRQQRQQNAQSEDEPPPDWNDGNGDATSVQRPLHMGVATDATAYRGEERREDQKRVDQISHTPPAGAHAREDSTEGEALSPPTPPSGPVDGFAPVASEHTLLAAVARHPMLATLHGDRTWAMRAVGALQSALCRAEDADAAIDAFVADHAASAPDDGPSLDAYVREHVGRYLKRAKAHGDAARARSRGTGGGGEGSPSSQPSPDARVVLDVFAEVWSARKGRPYVRTDSDERRAAEIVAGAREVGEQRGVRPRDVVRHAAEGYLRDRDPVVADKEHPFAFFVSRVNQYGAPKKAPSSRHEAAPTPPPAPPPPDLAAGLAEAVRAAQEGANIRRPGATP